MSGPQNGLNGHNGSLAMTNGNGASASASRTNGNGYSNGHGYPRSGSSSPGQSRVDERNLAMLQQLNLEVGNTDMAPKNAKGTLIAGEKELEIITNVYGLNHASDLNVHSFHMQLTKITPTRKIPVYTTKRCLPDHAAVMRRRFYQEVMPLFYLRDPEFFGDNANNHLVDYGHTLFSFRELPVVKNDDEKLEKLLELSADEAASVTHNAGVSLSLKPANVDFMIQNFSGVCRDFESYDGSVLRFNELATSHYVAQNFQDHCMFSNNKTYFLIPTKHGYSASDSVELGNGKFLAIGAEKTVILIEGADGQYSTLSGSVHSDKEEELAAAVAVDSKKSPFYMPILLADVICKLLKIRRNDVMTDAQIATLQPMFQQLTCHRNYGTTKSAVVIKRLTNVTPGEQIMVTEAHGNETVEQYFRRRYEITLECPNWPLAEMRCRGTSIYFPIELLRIADFQRVKALAPSDIREVIKACAVLPHRKLEEVQRSIQAFNINGDSVCQNAGISVTEEPIKVTARILTPPSINYSNGIVTPVDGRWIMPKAGKYLSACDCKNWVAVLIDYQFPRPYDLEVFQKFCLNFIDESRLRGITIAEPHDILKIKPSDEALEKLFEDARLADIEYILFCHPDEETTLHDHIKTFERKFMIVTQCVRTSTVDKVIHSQSKLSLENVIAKTNVKLGGHNYSISLNDYALDGKTLFIGFGMNHPGGGFGKNTQQDGSDESAVSILGYSANDSKTAGSFAGNFYVTKLNEDDQMPVISDVIEEILGRFLRNRGYPPSRVIIYRSGCSEGQYQRVLKYELPIYLHFVKKYSPQAPVSVIVPSKMHNIRFFRKNIDPADRAPAQNIPPGAVMDNTIVHPKYREFYLNSHVAIQGTAKTPRYTILFTTERTATLDVFQRWTNALCYNYQIVSSPVSVPAPVYIADCYAKRGRQIANNFALTKLNAAHQQMGLEISAEVRPDDAKNDLVKKSYTYNYSCRPDLRNRRINA